MTDAPRAPSKFITYGSTQRMDHEIDMLLIFWAPYMSIFFHYKKP